MSSGRDSLSTCDVGCPALNPASPHIAGSPQEIAGFNRAFPYNFRSSIPRPTAKTQAGRNWSFAVQRGFTPAAAPRPERLLSRISPRDSYAKSKSVSADTPAKARRYAYGDYSPSLITRTLPGYLRYPDPPFQKRQGVQGKTEGVPWSMSAE